MQIRLMFHKHLLCQLRWLDGTFTNFLREVSNTCNEGNYNIENGGGSNCSQGRVGEERQCKNGSCMGSDGKVYFPDEFEIVYRKCTFKEFCPYPPGKQTKHLFKYLGE